MTRIRRLVGPALLVAALTAASGCAMTDHATSISSQTAAPTASASTATEPTTAATTAAPSPTPSATAKPKPSAPPEPAKPAAMLEKGDKGEKVRELQHRLRQLDWYSGSITGRYQSSTVNGVKGF